MARVVSSLVLGPIVLLAIYLGPPASDGLLIAAAAVLAWEWGRVCGRQRGFGLAEGTLVAASAATLGAGAVAGIQIACVAAVLGALLSLLAATWDGRRPASRERDGAGRLPADRLVLWFGFGLFYVALPLLALQWLRGPAGTGGAAAAGAGASAGGLEVLRLFWLIGLVWATDIGAFFVGSTLRGPKLWPRISPNKTWSGMVGGLAAAGLLGAGFAIAAAPEALWALVVLSVLLSLVAQAGDFFESGVKRHFGAKDASGLIPGHGGLLDRVDGLLAATLALAFLAWLGKSPL
ncbi:MAG: phosphatidate cytidylyltransferase [Tistlia sp.]|uniref:phosphatidate cytidylyltransferase n=1 Tax=Tistlia sp. TaxID=3057121 RepID=UPI0034A267F1